MEPPDTLDPQSTEERRKTRRTLRFLQGALLGSLLVSIAMGAVAIGYGLEATKRRMETEEALAEVTRTEAHSRNLAYLALLSEIREQEQRRGQVMGADIFAKIRSAAALNPSEELRTEALKIMTRPGVRLESGALPWEPSEDPPVFGPSGLNLSGRDPESGAWVIRSLEDGRVLWRQPAATPRLREVYLDGSGEGFVYQMGNDRVGYRRFDAPEPVWEREVSGIAQDAPIVCSLDSRLMAFVGVDGQVAIWALATGVELERLDFGSVPRSIHFSGDSQSVGAIFGNTAMTLGLGLDEEAREATRRRIRANGGRVFEAMAAVPEAPDWVLATSRQIVAWIPQRKAHWPLGNTPSPIVHLAVAEKMRYVVAQSDDRWTRIWEPPKREPVVEVFRFKSGYFLKGEGGLSGLGAGVGSGIWGLVGGPRRVPDDAISGVEFGRDLRSAIRSERDWVGVSSPVAPITVTYEAPDMVVTSAEDGRRLADLFVGPYVEDYFFLPDGALLVVTNREEDEFLLELGELEAQLAELGLGWEARPEKIETIEALPGQNAALIWPWQLLVVAGGCFGALIMGGWTWKRQQWLSRRMERVEDTAYERGRELQRAREDLLVNQKMQALGTLSAGIAHDFNNLLSVIRMANKLVRRQSSEPQILDNTTLIEQAVEQGRDVTRAMLGYAKKSDSSGAAEFDPVQAVDEVINLLSQEFLGGVNVIVERPERSTVCLGSKQRCEQILVNLLINAGEALKGSGVVRIGLRLVSQLDSSIILSPRAAESYVRIHVEDSGPGIEPQNLTRVFEPFFSTKSDRQRAGVGLGLNIVYRIAEQEGFGLNVESQLEEGARFSIYLPKQKERGEA